MFKQKGGIVLLMYCAVFTRTIDLVKKDVQLAAGEFPLIKKPFNICTTDLLMLLITGRANGSVGVIKIKYLYYF